MTEEIEKKIQMLAQIRHDVDDGSYLNPFKAGAHIVFLLSLIDELTEALFKINAALQEKTKNDFNLDPGCK